MKNSKLVFILIALLVISTGYCQDQNWPEVAKNIVRTTANVQPGDIVRISGGKHTMPLMEQIAAEINRVGGHPQMVVSSDVALQAYWHEMPENNLSDYPAHVVEWNKEVDIMINLPNSENFQKIYKSVDPKRIALVTSNNRKLMESLEKETSFSTIGVAFPTKQIAELSGIDYAEYEKMHWAAVNADSKSLAAAGEGIMKVLKGAKKVRVTTTDGTDFSFAMGDRYVFADDGVLTDEERNNEVWFARYASLPGGWMDFAPLESSVNGKVVVPRTRCQYELFSDISFTIKDGILSDFKAGEGAECYQKARAPHTGDFNKVAVFTLGLNPELKVIQEGKTDFRSTQSGGYMTIRVGGNNAQYNGEVSANGSYSFPIINPTIEIDGKVVMKEGKVEL